LEPILQVVNAFTSVYAFLKDMKEIADKSKRRKWKLFGSKRTETMERKFFEALMGTQNAIESSIWYGKGFAIAAECGVKVDKEFHHLMGNLISKFNDIYMRLDPEKLDEKLIEHLAGQLKILEGYAEHLWNIQGIGNNPHKEEDALKVISEFEGRLRDFRNSMVKYLKAEPKAEE